MATVNVTGLTWDSKILTIGTQKWPFIQLNIAYAPGTQLDDNNTFDFTSVFPDGPTNLFLGGIASCVFSGKDLPLGSDTYYGEGDVKLHRRVGTYHAGTLLNYNNRDYGFFYDKPVSGIWTNSVNYQFVVYDILTDKYYVPNLRPYMLMTRWSKPEYMGVVDISGNPYAAVAKGDESGTSYYSVPFIYVEKISDVLKTTKGKVTDPYENGGSSGTGGGGGSFDNTSTPINIPSLPSISAASTGFISLFNPTLNQLNELSSYLWSDLFEINGWKKLFANPMDAILGLSIVPVAVPSGGTREVKVGNIGTGISLTVAASQFVEVDCGSIDVNEYWGAYLDYEPYTQAQIFLPYIGTRPISVDDIMGKTVRVVYHVDILTGACCCFVKCGDSVLYTYNGQCSIPIPITGANYTSVVNGVISVAASVGSLVATGGSSAPTAIPAIASSVVNQMKPQVEKSGSISGSAGVLNMQTPYLILIRPRQALPSKQNEFIGYPSLITVQLTELSGYTEVQSIHLENIPATQEELAEIESLLKGGVIF